VLDSDERFVRRLSDAMTSVGWRVEELTDFPDRSTLTAMRAHVLIVGLEVGGAETWLARQAATMPELAVIACTERSSVAQRVRSLYDGLDGWIAKPCDPWELLARVQAITRARRGVAVAVRPSVLAGEIDVSPSRYDAIAGNQAAGLTTREFEVLELLARHSGAAVERDRIYAGVWGDAVPAGDRSVDIFVGRIRFKLKRISPEWSYVHTHAGVGYRFAAERLAQEDVSPTDRELDPEAEPVLTATKRNEASCA
jgi:DNA-binding response OmpR family regulator